MPKDEVSNKKRTEVKTKKDLKQEWETEGKGLGYDTPEEYFNDFYGPLVMKKGGMTKGQKKISKVMREFKTNKLKSSSGQKVTNPKQAIAIALSEAGQSKKMKKAASGSFITKGGDYIKDLL